MDCPEPKIFDETPPENTAEYDYKQSANNGYNINKVNRHNQVGK